MRFGFGWGLAIGLAVAALVGTQSLAQGLFSSVVVVNDQIVTRYQLDQRTQFLTLLGVRDNPREAALNQLSIEALQLQAAGAAGIVASPEGIAAGQSEFAARANLTREQFLTAIGQAGVEASTFEDFVAAGIAWRAYVQQRFESEASDIPRDVLRRALETASLEADRRVLLSEIILPANTPEARAISLARAQEFSQIRDIEEFGKLASEFSLAQTRFRNGEVDWRPQSALPEQIANAVRNLQPGQSSRPVEIENSVSVYYLRDEEFVPPTTSQFAAIEYAWLQVPTRAEGAAALAGLDRCQDLEAKSRSYPESAFRRETTLLGAIPADLSGTLDELDQSEATLVMRGDTPVVVMLCQRTFGEGAEIDLNRLNLGIVNGRLSVLANRHLRELRDRAIVIRAEDG